MKKMMFFLAIAMVFTMASCSKDDDPYKPETPVEDSIYIYLDYTVVANFSPYTEYNNGCGVAFYDANGISIDGATVTRGVPLVIKGTRLFLILRDAVEMEVSAGTVLTCNNHSTESWDARHVTTTPANPGRIKVVKNMVVRWTPTFTFTQWW